MTSPEYTLSWDGRVLEGPCDVRPLLAGGALHKLRIRWSPRIAGGGTGPITGLDPAFLPRGVRLELVGFRRKGPDCLADYRVRRASG